MPELTRLPTRETTLGPLKILRALPVRERRMIGPWCFLDRYGPLSFTDGRPMDVAEHPHIGLQTVSYLFEGEVLHLDSLGSEAIVTPGGVNVMTAGRGIAHVELTPEKHSGRLSGVQLWAALPDEARAVEPSFDSLPEVPRVQLPGGSARLFMGRFAGAESRAKRHGDVVGADLECTPAAELTLPLEPSWEHAVMLASGDATLEGTPLDRDTLYYLGTSRSGLAVESRAGARLLLLGGPPFATPILMWWNFVARTPDEIATARAAWEQREFDAVQRYDGPRIEAPSLQRLAPPNPAS